MEATRLVLHDAFDRRAYDEVRAASARLGALEAAGERVVPGFDALLFDLFAAHFKLRVELIDESATPESAKLRRRILAGLLSSEHAARSRERTALDDYRSAMAAASLGERLLRALRQEGWIDAEDLATSRALAEREKELDHIREALAVLRALRRPSEHTSDSLETDGEIVADEIADLAREQERRVEEIPPALDTLLDRAEEALPDELDRAEEALEAWGTSVGTPARMSAAARLELGERLLRSEKLRRLASLVGAMKSVALAERRHRFERAVDETHSVRGSNEWSQLLPSELVHLGHPLRRLDLARRVIEGTALAYELRGQDARGRGPMVVCLDVSSSMEGAKELWAKAVALTLLEIARREGRAFRALCFSSHDARIERFDCLERHKRWRRSVGHALAKSAEVLRLAEYFPGGGTDFEAPLDAALRALDEPPWRRGDVVLVTDGECDVSAAFRERFLAAKRRLEAHLYAVLVDVGTHRADSLRTLADSVTLVSDLSADGARELMRTIR
jgi:uncharacterized protein with von Willebrand factor type A (vWA) domain